MLKQGPCSSSIRPWSFEKAPLKTALLMQWELEAFFATSRLPLPQPVTGNFNSLLSLKNSLFFLTAAAKRSELCGRACSRETPHGSMPLYRAFPCNHNDFLALLLSIWSSNWPTARSFTADTPCQPFWP
jgi:hypothetical protein